MIVKQPRITIKNKQKNAARRSIHYAWNVIVAIDGYTCRRLGAKGSYLPL